mgnify:CR=1 FL=1
MKKVIVTGTRGFIGVSLMKELDKLGYLTHGFDDSYACAYLQKVQNFRNDEMFLKFENITKGLEDNFQGKL